MTLFVQPQTSHLVQTLLLLIHDFVHFRVSQPVSKRQLPHVVVTKGLERAAVVLSCSRGLLIDNFVAIPRFVVIFLALLAVAVADVVRVVLFEFVSIHFFREL